MAALTDPSEEQAGSSIVDKARLLVVRLREVVADRDAMQHKVHEQRAEITVLKERLRNLEKTRVQAREQLQRLANQLPQK